MSDIYDEVDRRETDSRKKLSLNAISVVLCVHMQHNCIELAVKSYSSYALHPSVMALCKRLQSKTPLKNLLA